jgi:tetratricopeptide (TPR) repeat protein
MAESTFTQPVKIYYSYAYEDEAFLRRLNAHLTTLKRSMHVQTREKSQITPGTPFRENIRNSLDEAHIILLLISADYLNSDECLSFEVPLAMAKAERKEAVVIPIILRPVVLAGTPLETLQFLPRNGRAVSVSPHQDGVLAEIVSEIRQVVVDIQRTSARRIDWVAEGNKSVQAGRIGAALDAYEEALNQQPENISALLGKGTVLRNLGRVTDALVIYEQAIRLDPLNAPAYIGKGDALHGLGRLTEALVAYEQALQLSPVNNAAASVGKGRVLYDLQRHKDALSAYRQGAQSAPDNIDALSGIANVLFALENYAEARTAYKHVLRFDPNNSEAHLSLGDVCQSLQLYEEALPYYEAVIRLDPRKTLVYMKMGEIFRRLGRTEDALRAYSTVNSLDPANARAYLEKAVLYQHIGQHGEAALAFASAQKLGLDVEEIPGAPNGTGLLQEVSQALRARIELVQRFLSNAGFEILPATNDIGFLVRAQNLQWKAHSLKDVYVRVLFDIPLDQTTVQSIRQDATRYQCAHAFVIINQQPAISGWAEINILRGDVHQQHFVCLPIEEVLVQKGIADGQELLTLATYIEERMGEGFDPYDIRDAVSGTVSFFGRATFIEKLEKALQRRKRTGIFGIHKMGKSSVLRELQKRVEFPVAFVYLNPGYTLADIYNQIIEGWLANGRVKYPQFAWTHTHVVSEKSPSGAFNAATKSVLAYLSTLTETPPILGVFLDEIEHIVPSRGDMQQLQLYTRLMDSLRGLQQETGCIALLVAGVHPDIARRNYLWEAHKNPMHQIIDECFLSPLDEVDCKYMIRSLGQQIDLDFHESALQYILDMSGSHPFLARQLCTLARRKQKDRGVKGPISVDIVDEAVHEYVRNSATASYFDEYGLWGELGKTEHWGEGVSSANHQLLYLLAGSKRELAEEELCSCPGISSKFAYQAFYALKENSIIASNNKSDYYHITFGLFQNWISFHELGIEMSIRPGE